ncbi:MAG: hypothetical protein K0U74_15565 [Alphaproteobacteria bacterium]|nr:hypothetical protein [Alphaproteobacteria bacterium]
MTSQRGMLLAAGIVATGLATQAAAQVPFDAASDRRLGDYIYFKAFGEPKTPFEDLDSVGQVRANSSEYFRSELATCDSRKDTCDADNVYELADRFCQSLEFHEAATWRVSKDGDELVLHWAVCGLKK